MEYRDAVIVVERPLYSSTELAVEVEQRVELRLWGSGKATRGPVGLWETWSPPAFNEIAGIIAAGDLRIFVLERSDFPMEGGPVPVVHISNRFQGTWNIVEKLHRVSTIVAV
jgi:hypothetical protein